MLCGLELDRGRAGRRSRGGFALVDGHEFHAADRAVARLVGLDPRVHRALVKEHLAPGGSGRFSGLLAAEVPAEAAGERDSGEEREKTECAVHTSER